MTRPFGPPVPPERPAPLARVRLQRRAAFAGVLALLLAAFLTGLPAPARAECTWDTPLFEAYKPIYGIPYHRDYLFGEKGDGRREHEAVIQFSAKKVLLVCGAFQWTLAYTQRSFWQVWDKANSAPFRETDYNPEAFVDIAIDRTETPEGTVAPLWLRLGIEHESNGQPVPASRSWNRTYAQLTVTDTVFAASLKIWDRWNEGGQSSPTDPGGDDNPDLLTYMGSWEARVFAALPPYVEATVMFRRGKDRLSHFTTYQVDLDYLAANRVWLRLQYFSGYGESLIDYNREVRRIGLGIALKPDTPGRHRVD